MLYPGFYGLNLALKSRYYTYSVYVALEREREFTLDSRLKLNFRV